MTESTSGAAPGLHVDAVMAELQSRVRERVRSELRRHGASEALEDAALFAEVDRLLRDATSRARTGALLLPELLGDPATWRLETSLRYQTHRGAVGRFLVVPFKRRILTPVLRWLYEFSRDNFERQARVNQVLFACVQELAIENARLRADLQQLAKH